MRLGLSVGYSGATIDLPMDMIREADRLGYYAVWTAEAYGSDAVTPLAWIGAQTTQIHLGTAIMQMPARTPAMTAMTAITLDQLSGGRMLLGLGLSGPQVVEGWHGQPYGKPLGKTREYVSIVRTIFDGRNRPQAKLVLGEVVTFPGRWSSYPPHHHPQPEIYHYRFTDPRGYGHAELGDDVLKVQQHDTIKILDFNDHSQVAAPGYGMYYIWAIRHLDGDPYTVPEFTREHAWLNAPQPPDFWRPTKLIARGDDDEGGSR